MSNNTSSSIMDKLTEEYISKLINVASYTTDDGNSSLYVIGYIKYNNEKDSNKRREIRKQAISLTYKIEHDIDALIDQKLGERLYQIYKWKM